MPLSGITLIIPAYNAERYLNQNLKSIFSQDVECPFEVILVNNNSTDQTLKIAKEYSCKIILESRQGRSHARNAGVNHAQYDYIVFIDSDVILPKNWLKNLIPFLELYSPDGVECSVKNSGEDSLSFLNLYRDRFRGGTFNLEALNSDKFPIINSAACIYKKSTFQKVGGFDPQLNWFEDADLSKRVFFSGGNLLTAPTPPVLCYFDGGHWQYLKRKYNAGRLGSMYYLKWRSNRKLSLSEIIKGTILRPFPSGQYSSKKFKILSIGYFYLLNILAFLGHLRGRSINKYQHSDKENHLLTSEKIKGMIITPNESLYFHSDVHYIKTPQFLFLRNRSTEKIFVFDNEEKDFFENTILENQSTENKHIIDLINELKQESFLIEKDHSSSYQA